MYKAWARAFHSSKVTSIALSARPCSVDIHDVSTMSIYIHIELCQKIVKEIYLSLSFADLEEVALPLEEYPSMRDFFSRGLREGCRPIDNDPQCLVTGNSFLVSICV